MTFEKSMGRLEEIVKLMDTNDLSLEESLKLYEEGTLIVANCQKELENAQLKIEKLSQKGEEND